MRLVYVVIHRELFFAKPRLSELDASYPPPLPSMPFAFGIRPWR